MKCEYEELSLFFSTNTLSLVLVLPATIKKIKTWVFFLNIRYKKLFGHLDL